MNRVAAFLFAQIFICTPSDPQRGGQHLSPRALRSFSCLKIQEGTNSNILVMWMRENIQLYDTFILFLCGAATTYKRKMHGYPGIMETIGDYLGLIRGKEIRMLKEFNELVSEYIVVIDYDKIKPKSDTFKYFKRCAGRCGKPGRYSKNGCIRIQGKKVIVSEDACHVCVNRCKQTPGDAVSVVKRVIVVVGA